MSTTMLITIVLVSICITVVPIISIYLEKRGYNGGICPYCDVKLHRFDVDSHGCRGYCCEKCGDYVTWVGWDSIDRDYLKNLYEKKGE